MYKTKRAGKQNFKQQNEILTQPTLVQKSVPAKVYNNRTKRIWEVMFASKHTRVETPSKSIPTLRKDLRFSASSHSIHEKVFPAKYHKVGKGLKRFFTQFLKQKNRNLDKKFFTKHYFPAVMDNHTPKQRSCGDFAFTFPTLFESGN